VRFPGLLLLISAAAISAGNPEYDRARELYQRTEYQQSLAALASLPVKDAAALELIGQNHFRLGEYKKATEAFEKALAIAGREAEPKTRSELHHWLGKTYGRRAETGSLFTAPGNASKARAMFEEAVRLDPANHEAVNDLFDFYLQAPGIVGGSMEKAEELARGIAQRDPAEGHFAQAQLDEKRKRYAEAEQHLRRAAELEAWDAGRWLDVANFLARRGRLQESDEVFEHAAAIAPVKAIVWFERAEVYIRHGYRLDDARMLLDRYVRAQLKPEDPPKREAKALLEKLGTK
jgi:tetratricopeptide (TPR) repeat protein